MRPSPPKCTRDVGSTGFLVDHGNSATMRRNHWTDFGRFLAVLYQWTMATRVTTRLPGVTSSTKYTPGRTAP